MYASGRSSLILCTLVFSACGSSPSATEAELLHDPSQALADALAPQECGRITTLRRGINGTSLQGTAMAAGAVSRITIGCADVSEVHLEGSLLVGKLGGRILRGTDLVGATMTTTDPSGTSSLAVIAGVESDPQDETGSTHFYRLRGRDPVSGEVVDLCAPDQEGQRRAIPVPGRWSASGAREPGVDSITFGCTSAAIGKCVRLGYRPWQSRGGVSLVDAHRACTRMLRFDYCGDGQAHTESGTEIDLYDRIGINQKGFDPLFLFDAAWTPDGAYCIERQRWLRLSVPDLLSLKTLLPSGCLSQFELTVESSPVDPLDLCAVRRRGASPSAVLIDSRSPLSITLR